MSRRLRAVLLPLVAAVLASCGGGSSPSAPPGSRPLTYVALGASDAVGIGAFPITEGYVYELARRMETVRDPVTLRNLGINGARIEEIVASELDDAIRARPDVVTLWTGPNDVIRGANPDVFAALLRGLLGRLRAETSAVVFVGDLPDLTQAPLFRVDPDPDVTRARIDVFNAHIEAAVALDGAVLVRLSALSLELDTFSIDGFHPSNTGHRRIADLYWPAIHPRL